MFEEPRQRREAVINTMLDALDKLPLKSFWNLVVVYIFLVWLSLVHVTSIVYHCTKDTVFALGYFAWNMIERLIVSVYILVDGLYILGWYAFKVRRKRNEANDR